MNTREDAILDTGESALQLSDFIVCHHWWLFIGVSSSLQVQVVEGILLRPLQGKIKCDKFNIIIKHIEA